MNPEIPKFNENQERREKVILTGGTEGIGRAIAIELAEEKHGYPRNLVANG